MEDRIRGTLGAIDPLNKVPVQESQKKVQKGFLSRVPLVLPRSRPTQPPRPAPPDPAHASFFSWLPAIEKLLKPPGRIAVLAGSLEGVLCCMASGFRIQGLHFVGLGSPKTRPSCFWKGCRSTGSSVGGTGACSDTFHLNSPENLKQNKGRNPGSLLWSI